MPSLAFVRPMWSAVLHSLRVCTGVAMAAALLALGLPLFAGDPAPLPAPVSGVAVGPTALAHDGGTSATDRAGTDAAAQRPATRAATEEPGAEAAAQRAGRTVADDAAHRRTPDNERQQGAHHAAGLPEALERGLSARPSAPALGGATGDRSPVGLRAPPLR